MTTPAVKLFSAIQMADRIADEGHPHSAALYFASQEYGIDVEELKAIWQRKAQAVEQARRELAAEREHDF